MNRYSMSRWWNSAFNKVGKSQLPLGQTWYFSETDVWESRTVLRWTKNTCIREHRVGVKWWPNPRQAATLSRNPCSRRGVTADHREGGGSTPTVGQLFNPSIRSPCRPHSCIFKWRNPSLQLVVIKGDPLFWNFHSLAGGIKIAFLILPPPLSHRTSHHCQRWFFCGYFVSD